MSHTDRQTNMLTLNNFMLATYLLRKSRNAITQFIFRMPCYLFR